MSERTGILPPSAAWRVLYRAQGDSDGPWLTDGDYSSSEEAIHRVFEIRANVEEGQFDAYTKPVFCA